jgi:enoyl-CoA hydratase/3-hydroxyacyl-CoA dehydrogenase
MSTPADTRSAAESIDVEQISERFALKALVEACLVLEERVASLIPPPFARADGVGLDETLAALERAEQEHGERYAAPAILRRLVAQGRLGRKTGQGFFPYPQPDEGFDQGEAVKLETRTMPGDAHKVAIAWLDRPPANSIAPQVIEELARIWAHVEPAPEVRALIIASANPMLYSAGADIKAFTTMDEDSGRELLDEAHGLLRSFERSSMVTIAAVNALAFGGGCELAMACDFRLAAGSATFGQPEINLGILPGFGGTQRLPRLVGEAKALEMNLTGEPISAAEAYELGLVNLVVEDHELFDTALSWARKLAGQAPLPVQRIKCISHAGDLDEGIEAEKQAFMAVFASEDAREGISAFLGKRTPRFRGK